MTAFQMLAGEGYTVSAGARGTVVNVVLPRARKSKPSTERAETGGKLRRSINAPPMLESVIRRKAMNRSAWVGRGGAAGGVAAMSDMAMLS
jgi:hypothetical protein